jgi:hypothetical protein
VGFGGNARKEKRGDITTASGGRKEETTQQGRKHARVCSSNTNSNKRQGSRPEGTQPKQNRRKERIKQTTDKCEMAMSSRK